MLPKSQHTEHHQKATTPKAPPPSLKPEVAPAPLGRISAARAAVQQFLATELGAREIRITKIAPLNHGSEGWSAEAEILVPNLEVKMLGLPLTQEVLELEHYIVELETDLTVRSYGHLGADND
ncbi:hypothetical protein RZS28_11850 [Methylocapsa polymorpha]|uniref:Uncharacterized protein n=1 Tax=Methylocapsa polymorpha TaxID=3080828 RepID=A0ABZ0HRG4_9HYPH|nr:hypothetical protein RZS28_11850 [Methylocapsa sp. RX1]